MYFTNCDLFMKINSVVQKLFTNQVYQLSSLTVALLVAAQLTPVIAQPTPTQSPSNTTEATDNTPIPGAITNPSSGANNNINGINTETDYTLGPGDQIKLDIFQVAEYSGEYPVLVDGTISIPLVGKVNVNGLTLKETSDLVSEKYKLYLKRPVVTVGLISPRPMNITIAGEVNDPGSYKVNFSQTKEFPTAVSMVRQAGGITTLADIRNVQVRRKVRGAEQVFSVNAWKLFEEGRLDDLRLRDGDTLFIPTVKEVNLQEIERLASAGATFGVENEIQVAIIGEIYRPGRYTVQPRSTQKTNLNQAEQTQSEQTGGNLPPRLSDALALAGGIKPLANVKKVEVERQTWDGQKKTVTVDLWNLLQQGDQKQDLILQEGDSIKIPQAEQLSPEDSETLASATFSPDVIKVNVVGEVGTPGPVEVPPNTPLNQAILAAGGFDAQRAKTGNVELVRLNPNGTVTKRQIQVDFASGINDENNPTLRNNDVVVVSRSGLASVSDTTGSIFNPIGGALGVVRLLFGL
ncbi:polysaccharide export protein [Stanieria sp. NIES-3757]|nr:polysaccharide export protein [Stanieria sp. NIES-3757]